MIRKFLDLSTAHLKPDTLAMLSGRSLETLPFAGGATSYGWFAYAHDENAGEGDDAIPDDLFACMQHARSLGCDYLHFDCDGEEVDGLPVFDHGESTEGRADA